MDEARDDQIWCACTPTPIRKISECDKCAMDWATILAAAKHLANETEQHLKFRASVHVGKPRREAD